MEKEGLLSGEPVSRGDGCQSKCDSLRSRCHRVCGVISSFLRIILHSFFICTVAWVAYETFCTGLDTPFKNFKDVAYCTRNATLSLVSSHGSSYHECRVRSLWCRDWSRQCFLAYDPETYRDIDLRYFLEQKHPKQNISVEPVASDFDLAAKSYHSRTLHSDPPKETTYSHILNFADWTTEHLNCEFYDSSNTAFLYDEKHNIDEDADFGPGITPIGFSANHTRLPWSIVQEVWANKTGIPTLRVAQPHYEMSSQVACFPSTGGVWIADMYPVDLEYLGLDRINDVALPVTDTNQGWAREDELCTQLRLFGASWYQTDPPRYNGYSHRCSSKFQWCVKASPCRGKHAIALPKSGGAWILDIDDYYDRYYYELDRASLKGDDGEITMEDWDSILEELDNMPRIEDLGKAWTMDEKAEIIKGLGAKFYERLEDFAPLQESGVLEGNFKCEYTEPEDDEDEDEDFDHWYKERDVGIAERSPAPLSRLRRKL